MPVPRLLYFSLNANKRTKFITDNCNDGLFRLIDIDKNFTINRASDLSYILTNLVGCQRNVYVIIDYLPMCKTWKSLYDNAKCIRAAILQFPEVNFLFEEPKDKQFDFSCFLLNGLEYQQFHKEFHKYYVNANEPYRTIKYKFDNLFDASNLRYAVKSHYYEELRVNKHNFKKVQDTRSNNLAISVEEESAQNRFNSYALYANGMRVLPVTTAYMLAEANTTTSFGKPTIVVRDYDLQFPDADESDLTLKEYAPNNKLIDAIRSVNFNDKNNTWKVLLDENKFWNKISGNGSETTFFITKGRKNMDIESRQYHYFTIKDCKDGQHLQVSGLEKPVTGLYKPFHSLKTSQNDIVKDIYYHTAYTKEDDGDTIDTSRRNHDHGVPLDLYDMAREMIERANNYFANKKYVHAALIANEAIEVMNGFHQSLTLKAYHLNAIAENAIAANAIGGDENMLTEDTDFRIDKIENDIHRFLFNRITEDESLKKHILNQIYKDCRTHCKEKGHFDAENQFIEALAQLNEHSTIKDILHFLKGLFKH